MSLLVALPRLQDKPSFHELCAALDCLAIQPTSWSSDKPQEPAAEDVKDVNTYLLAVISSGLKWLKVDSDDGQTEVDPKEVVWDMASRRMAERCGRSGM
jgi:hypothetical protein